VKTAAWLKWSAMTLFGLFPFQGIFAQGIHSYPVQGYTVEDGLSQTSVYLIAQDADGYIWAGTGDGLNRISPQNIRSFKTDTDRKAGLFAKAIRGIVPASDGRIWIGTERGLNFYHPADQTIHRAVEQVNPSDGAIMPLGFHNEFLICLDQLKGFFALDVNSGKIERRYSFEEVLPTDQRMYNLIGDTLWFLTQQGRVRALSMESGSSVDYRGNWSQNAGLTALRVLPENYVLVASGSELYLLNRNRTDWKEFFKAPDFVRAIEIVDHREIWLGMTEKGLMRIDFSGNVIEKAVNQSKRSGKSMWDFNTVYEITQTPDGLVWLGVEGLGAISMNTRSPFLSITKNDPYFPGMEHEFCKTVLALNDSLVLIDTYLGGIYQLDLKAKKALKLKFSSETGEQLYFLAKWDNGFVMGTETGLWYAKGTHKSSGYTIQKLSSEVFNSALQQRDRLLLARDNELFQYSGQTLGRIHFFEGNFRGLATAPNGGYYIWTNETLALYSGSNELLAETKSTEIQGFKNVLHHDTTGLWAVTENGIAQLQPEKLNVIRNLTVSSGLPDNTIYGILPAKGALWGSTNRGLFRFDFSNDFIDTFSHRDGLQSNEFNSRAFAILPDGRLIFGGIHGITIFDPEVVATNASSCQLKMSGVEVNGERIELNASGHNFAHNDRNFTFHWDVLQWIHPQNSEVLCKLEGFDQDWGRISSRNTRQYSALLPGQYVLRAKLASSTDEDEHAVEFARFTVVPPVHQTWWFISGMVALLFLIVGALVYYVLTMRYRKQVNALRRKHEMDELRNRISRDIHDDVGSDLSKIRMYLSQIEETGEKRNMLEKAKHLSQHAMEGLSEVIWTVNSDYDRLPEMVAWFRNYAFEFFEDTDLQVEFKAPENLPNKVILPEWRRNLLMLYKEALNNILKHAAATKVSIELTILASGHLKMEISDNGKGFVPGESYTRNGIRNMNLRANKSGWNLKIRSDAGIGTTVSIVSRF